MGQRKISILEPAATAIAETAYFIESQGLPATAKKFVDNIFQYFEKLADDRIEHKPCNYRNWHQQNYRCVTYKKKYVIAYLCLEDEIVICEFVPAKLLH